MSEIFSHCLLVFGFPCIPHHYKDSAPIILSTVCGTWRDIALAMHTLWSELEVRFDDLGTGVVSKTGLIVDSIDRWLSRAGSCPLSLDFMSHEDLFALSCLRVAYVIHRWSHRVKDLSVDIR
ncbi:hypothetical protein B0H14DRAFT_1234205 [Mycena olivaceomarginata]|nr:hypothetical protein B0H14DRAFT_1234205 [Mycena olivaceomarginata]